jgi:hypothetical protein
MSRGRRGSAVSVHDGESKKRTCIIVASGANAGDLADDIREFAKSHQGYRYSKALPQVSVQWGETIQVTGEGGNISEVAEAIIEMLHAPPPAVATEMAIPKAACG